MGTGLACVFPAETRATKGLPVVNEQGVIFHDQYGVRHPGLVARNRPWRFVQTLTSFRTSGPGFDQRKGSGVCRSESLAADTLVPLSSRLRTLRLWSRALRRLRAIWGTVDAVCSDAVTKRGVLDGTNEGSGG